MEYNFERAQAFFEDLKSFTTGPVELKKMKIAGDEFVLVDVRRPDDFAIEHIPGAINLPQDRWHTYEGLSKDKINIVYCYTAVCRAAVKACHFFSCEGFPVMEMEGGIEVWKNKGFSLHKKGDPSPQSKNTEISCDC